MKLPMKLSINRCDGSQGSWVNLEVTDEISGTTFLTLKIAFEEFAKAVTGLSLQPCQGEVRCLERLGLYEISEPRMVVFTGKRNRAYKDMRLEPKPDPIEFCNDVPPEILQPGQWRDIPPILESKAKEEA